MIKWNAGFNIPDSTVQVAEAFIKVASYQNINGNCTVKFEFSDGQVITVDNEPRDNVFKELTKTYERTFSNVNEIYEVAVLEYENAVIV